MWQNQASIPSSCSAPAPQQRRAAAASLGQAHAHRSWASRRSGWSSTARCPAGCGCRRSSRSWSLHLFARICLSGRFCGGGRKERLEPPQGRVRQLHSLMGTSLPVYVEFSVVGQVVINDQGHLRHIQASSPNICWDEDSAAKRRGQLLLLHPSDGVWGEELSFQHWASPQHAGSIHKAAVPCRIASLQGRDR